MLTRNYFRHCLIAVLLFHAPFLNAQLHNAVENISTTEGLSQGMIFDLLQDKEDFIWVATKNGLNRYDGYGFKVFVNDPYNIHTLSSNTIVKLFEDSRGRIWVGTEDAGVNIYEKKTGLFYRIRHKAGDPASLSDNNIRAIEELPDGRMIVATSDGGLNVMNPGEDFFKSDTPALITKLRLPNNTALYGMGKDKSNVMWMGGMDGTVYRFDPLNNSFTRLEKAQLLNNGYFTADSSILINANFLLDDGKKITPLFDIQKKPVGNIIFRSREKLWENFHRELTFYDVSKWEPGKTACWTEQLPVATRLYYPFIIDRSGIIWSGTVGYGLHKYNDRIRKLNPALPGNSVRWIVPVSDNDIFIGDYAYGWKRLKNDKVEDRAFQNISSVIQIDNFIVTRKGDYYIKSDQKGLVRYNPVTGAIVYYPLIRYNGTIGAKQPMFEDAKGDIWFPYLSGEFYRLEPTTGRIDSFNININPVTTNTLKSFCTTLYQDKEGTFWVGTQEGFARLHFDEGKTTPDVKWFSTNSSSRNSLNYNHVSCFLDDPEQPGKFLWICTKGGGLNRLDKKTGDFFHFTSSDGLPDNVVYGILNDSAGNIWGSTNRGIFCLVKNHQKIPGWIVRSFSKTNGLQDDEFNTGSYAKLSNGNLAFGGVKGLNIFDPKEVLSGGFVPNVFVTNIMVNNSTVTPGDGTGILKNTIDQTGSITLNHLQDILTLEFSSLDFTAPIQNKYRYRLDGIDKEWTESGARRVATYVHLPAGNYTFLVQGSNSQGTWSDKLTRLQIQVLPPWWRTWWALGIYVLLLIIAIRLYLKFSVNRARLKSQLAFEQREAKRMKEIDNLKTRLYTNITHEFRTPLTVILGMASQIASNPAAHAVNGSGMIIRNGQSLLKLVNEMLDLSKLESGKMELTLVQGDIVSFLRYIVESFHSLAENQQKQLHFLSELEEYHTIYDAQKMQQIISNLLSNALKFTPERGNIYISLKDSKMTVHPFTPCLVIKIRDTGIGISEGKLSFIFERFYQTDASNTRVAQGSGIGLSLTKELVRLMNGSITVKSPPLGTNKGTEFTLELPFEKMETNRETAIRSDITGINIRSSNYNGQTPDINRTIIPDDERALILLVEDNADVVTYTASCLPEYRLAVAQDGKEGFEIATEIIPDLIISDVMMPLMDGFALLQKLKNDFNTSHIPVVMLTAKADMESRFEGIEKGADAYIEKPFNPEELQLRIKKLLELRKKLQQFYKRRAGLSSTSPEAVEVEKESLIATPPDSFIVALTKLIEENLNESEFSVEHLCRAVFMSHSKLHRKLTALTGCSPSQFIRMVRLKKAKELLQDHSLTIISVAGECGFNDAGYFSRVFKQEFGKTPQEWREGKGKFV